MIARTCQLLSMALLAACAAGRPLDRLPEMRDLRAADPAPFHIAIAPLTVDSSVDLAASPQFGAESRATNLRAELARDLQELRAASIVEILDDEMIDSGADLVLRPRVSAAEFEYLGSTRDGLLSSLLWITTWAGGLFVADSDYEAHLQIDWEVVNPHSGQTIANLAGSPRSIRLGFFDRNGFWSWATLQSLVIPPVFTSDDAETTAHTLWSIALAHSAGELAGFLKSSLGGDERELLGEVRLESPRNGSTVADGCVLRGAVLAHDLIAEVSLLINGEPLVHLDGEALPPRSRQQIGARTFRVPVPEVALPLVDGENRVVIEFVTGGRRTSRTLVLNHKPTRGES